MAIVGIGGGCIFITTAAITATTRLSMHNNINHLRVDATLMGMLRRATVFLM